MIKNNTLTEGSISKALVRLALPIMATSFVQMFYNMTDIFWIGKLGELPVAAVGTAGFFMWLGMAFIFLPKIGAEVGVSQSVGRNDSEGTRSYIIHALQMIIVLAALYSSFLLIFKNQLIEFFRLKDAATVQMAVSYLTIIACGLIFNFLNPIFTAILNGYGNSSTPFRINSIGLLTNLILDPIMIFGLGPIPAMGVRGAAYATVLAQAIVTFIFIYTLKNKTELFQGFTLIQRPNFKRVIGIMKIGLPVGIQSGLFTIIAMAMARIISGWGDTAIAVQKVGSQIEAVSWMTAGGFSTALSAFVGQNYGAKKYGRIYKGYFIAMGFAAMVGIFATFLLTVPSKFVFGIFLSEKEALRMGIVYLKILGVSQLFMCLEIATGGAFNGLGKTIPPSIVSITFNALRIPTAIVLSATALDLNGVWWSISLSSIFKGIVLVTWFVIVLNKLCHGIDKENIRLFKVLDNSGDYV